MCYPLLPITFISLTSKYSPQHFVFKHLQFVIEVCLLDIVHYHKCIELPATFVPLPEYFDQSEALRILDGCVMM
jgi:hypothetical protein